MASSSGQLIEKQQDAGECGETSSCYTYEIRAHDVDVTTAPGPPHLAKTKLRSLDRLVSSSISRSSWPDRHARRAATICSEKEGDRSHYSDLGEGRPARHQLIIAPFHMVIRKRFGKKSRDELMRPRSRVAQRGKASAWKPSESMTSNRPAASSTAVSFFSNVKARRS